MIDGGYFGKLVEPRPELIKAAAVREICSVSNCISSGPDGWVGHWLHNEFGWFNHTADALRILPQEERSRYRLFAYRVAPAVYRKGSVVELAVPADVAPDPLTPQFQRIGFDAVNKSMDSVLGFECSPLSCNYLAAEMQVNEFCLFPTLEAAMAGAERFSLEEPEPGDYYVVEVLETKREAA